MQIKRRLWLSDSVTVFKQSNQLVHCYTKIPLTRFKILLGNSRWYGCSGLIISMLAVNCRSTWFLSCCGRVCKQCSTEAAEGTQRFRAGLLPKWRINFSVALTGKWEQGKVSYHGSWASLLGLGVFPCLLNLWLIHPWHRESIERFFFFFGLLK